jgi:hypothetical protein
MRHGGDSSEWGSPKRIFGQRSTRSQPSDTRSKDCVFSSTSVRTMCPCDCRRTNRPVRSRRLPSPWWPWTASVRLQFQSDPSFEPVSCSPSVSSVSSCKHSVFPPLPQMGIPNRRSWASPYSHANGSLGTLPTTSVSAPICGKLALRSSCSLFVHFVSLCEKLRFPAHLLPLRSLSVSSCKIRCSCPGLQAPLTRFGFFRPVSGCFRLI